MKGSKRRLREDQRCVRDEGKDKRNGYGDRDKSRAKREREEEKDIRTEK
jgi:hypothetical protein